MDQLFSFVRLSAFPINPVSFALERTRASILESLSAQGIMVLRDKLTDINLLKRHVLKRCIYGVDLNPMAVELAKVSLWLDAFTLGAPLSFLNHHLRPGNSLVGTTMADLEAATSGRLFGLDYGPLLDAIKYVLFVSKIADATAAEVADSIRQYAEARRCLSGYEIILHLLLAEYFGLPQAKALVSSGSDLDLSNREAFLASLHGEKERKLVTEVEALAKRPDLRFFHWEIEFPEVFTGFFDPNQTTIMHKDRIKKGTAGFDVVIGNPPYVRQEALRPLKAFLKERYETFDSANDLYVYFQESEVRNLRVHGRMGMIVANKWMRAGYGEKVRDFLLRKGQPLEVIDFGHAPIFPDADTFPCILLTTKRAKSLLQLQTPPESETMAACEVPRVSWNDRMNLGVFVGQRRHKIPTHLLRREGWSLEHPSVLSLLERIRSAGRPLREFVGYSPLMGLKTGFNEAFVIDAATRDGLIRENGGSDKVIRPLLRGRDAARWTNRDSASFLIMIPSSENKDWPWSGADSKAEQVFRRTFPAVYSHFLPFKSDLINRQDQGRFYWELRSCDYMEEFDKPKIVYQDLAWFSEFAWDDSGCVANNTVYFLPTNDPVLLAVLNSPLLWWYMWRTAQHGKDEVLRLFTDFVATLPIASFKEASRWPVQDLIQQTIKSEQTIRDSECQLGEEARHVFSVAVPNGKLAAWLPLDSEEFARRFLKVLGERRPNPALVPKLAKLREQHRARQLELLTRQLELERILAGLVEDAFGLTPEERALLRATRPLRDPLDVLEAKIRGEITEDSPAEG